VAFSSFHRSNARPKSIINGRDDLIKQPRPVTDDPFQDDDTPPWPPAQDDMKLQWAFQI
jgi:hypothetical protein